MNVSYEGIGQWSVCSVCGTGVEAGKLVKISDAGTVSGCNAGDAFAGTVMAVARDGKACAVALGGMVTAEYTGTAVPALGWAGLSADGTGGVKADSAGRTYLVVEVDDIAKTVTFVL